MPTALLLPNGKQQFIDINGAPLVGGTVGMYIPSTLTPKNTWQDSGQTVLNANPLTLDSRGQAIIWGAGSYRQIVKDSLGNLIWDEVIIGQVNDQSPILLTTLTASNSASLIFTGFTSAYSTYEFVFNGIVCATDNKNFEAQLSLNAGSTWLSGSNYNYGGSYWSSSGATSLSANNSSGNTLWLINNASGAGLSNANALSGKLRLQNMNSSSIPQYANYDFGYLRTGADYWYGGCAQATYSSVGVKNGIKFFMSAGNITSGSISIYGVP